MSDTAPKRAGAAAWIGLTVLALPTFVVAIDLFVLLLALPTFAADLGADSLQQLWVSDIYGFVLAGFLISMGTLGDRIGRRKLLMIGATAFAIASLTSAYAPTIELLIASRAVLGIAGATLMPSTLALIGGLFSDPRQRAAAFGVWGGVYTIGAALGPVLGGLLLEYFWWGSVFLLGIPFMIAMLALAPRYLPESRDPDAGRLDIPSVSLSLTGLLALIYGIKELTRTGPEPVAMAAVACGLVLGWLFLRRQRRLAEPLLDLKLFKNDVISATLVNQLVFSAVGGGLMLLSLLFFQLVGDMTTVQAALAMVPGMLAGAASMLVAPRLAARHKPGNVIGVGMFLTALLYLGLAFTSVEDGTWMLMTGFVLISLCGTPAAVLGTGLVVGNAPPEKMGSAGSLAQMSNEFGATLGLALLGTIAAAVYRGLVTVPATVPVDEAADDSLAGAVAVASELPSAEAERLLEPARDAFVDGIQVVGIVSAVLCAFGGVLVMVRLRRVGPIGQRGAPDPAERAMRP